MTNMTIGRRRCSPLCSTNMAPPSTGGGTLPFPLAKSEEKEQVKTFLNETVNNRTTPYHGPMIPASATLSIQRLLLSSLRFFQHEKRYPNRLLHYIEVMSRPENTDSFPGVVSVKPLGDGTYQVLDGHHRVLAHVMVGRGEVLCLVIEEG